MPILTKQALSLVESTRVQQWLNHFDDPVRKNTLRRRVEEAAAWLTEQHPQHGAESLLEALEEIFPRLERDKVKVFFSYKEKDRSVAEEIVRRLHDWSQGGIKISSMYDLGVLHVGRDWREKIEAEIPDCDIFLMLLPSPGEGEDRDWLLYEAGYFSRGKGLAGRLICLHHPDTEVADALGTNQSVPATFDSVRKFLLGLFRYPNYIPGRDPINPVIDKLDEKAEEIVHLIRPSGHVRKFCCGPHMEVRFGNAALVDSVEALRAGQVIESNQECLDLFGLHASRETLGEWFDELPVTDQKWLQDLSAAVHAVGGGHKVRQIESSFTSVDGCNYQPRICAYRKREVDDVIESLDFMFTPVEESSYLTTMSPDLEALAICLDYAVRIRYQLLEPFMGRDLDQGDLQDFGKKYVSLLRQSLASRSLMEANEIRQRLLTFFVGDERSGLEAILARSDEFWPPDDPNGGEMSTAIFSGDPMALQKLLAELASMNQTFLILASRKFSDVLARDVPRSASVR